MAVKLVDLDKLQALCDAATEGPWYAHKQYAGKSYFVMISQTYGLFSSEPHAISLPQSETIINVGGDKVWEENKGQEWPSEDNANFIAASREAMPLLIAEVRKLREVLTTADDVFLGQIKRLGAKNISSNEMEWMRKKIAETLGETE